jgi:nitrile hydratase
VNGIHDMGGMQGFGPILREENEPVYHARWEGRVHAMVRQFGGVRPAANAGAFRDLMENIEPRRYLEMSYYERFLEGLIGRALAEGVITQDELAGRAALIEREGRDPVAPRLDPELAAIAVSRLKTYQPRPLASERPPRFAVGEAVVVRNLNWRGHNRLPRYIRGKRGVVERINGCYRIEDANAAALGPDPQTVYTVRFEGAEVWGEGCEPNLKVFVELWEGYLSPAGG